MSFGLTPQHSDLGLVHLRASSLLTTTKNVCNVLDADVIVARSINGIVDIMPDVITTEGDLIVGNVSGQPSRMSIGATDTVLQSNGTTAMWGTAPTPITTEGDIIVGNASGTAARLPLGANATVLQSNGTTAVWGTAPTPITTEGDIIVGNASGTAVRLPIGSNGAVLASDGVTASWLAGSSLSTGLNVQYTGISRSASNIDFGPVTNGAPLQGGVYGVAVTVNDLNYIVPVTGSIPAWFRIEQTGNYLFEFSSSVALNTETNLNAQVAANTNSVDPFNGLGATFTTICTLGAPATGDRGALVGRLLRTFSANDTFGIRISGATSGAETWVTGAVLTVKPLL